MLQFLDELCFLGLLVEFEDFFKPQETHILRETSTAEQPEISDCVDGLWRWRLKAQHRLVLETN